MDSRERTMMNGVCKMDILHVRNLSNVANTLARMQNQLGHHALSINLLKQYQHYRSDIGLNLDSNYPSREIFSRFGIITKTFLKNTHYDIFHLHDGGILPLDADAKFWFTMFGKVIVHWHGSKIRRHKSPLFSKYAKYTFVSTPDLLQYVKDSEWLPNPLIPDGLPIPQNRDDNDEVTIIHAPTDKVAKGTMKIEVAVKALIKEGYKINFQIVENTSHEETIRLLSRADVVVDQIVPSVGTYGMVSIESMAMGKPVLCYIKNDYYEDFYRGCPIISAEFDDLVEKLRNLIEDENTRRLLGVKGIDYVRKMHDAENIAKRTIKVYEELTSGSI